METITLIFSFANIPYLAGFQIYYVDFALNGNFATSLETGTGPRYITEVIEYTQNKEIRNEKDCIILFSEFKFTGTKFYLDYELVA